ncbi:MAG TPA: DNA-binding protein, partial [Niabella sp.]|nr:DNA-binding protein [Niabella sp.]
GRTYVKLPLYANGSAFVVFRKKVDVKKQEQPVAAMKQVANISAGWKVQFDPAFGGPVEEVSFPALKLWNQHDNNAIKYYSGTAVYKSSFSIEHLDKFKPVYLTVDSIFNIATVTINGVSCGTLWTPPYRLDVSKAIKAGENTIEIKVANTWANRLIGDLTLPEDKRITWTTAPLNLLQNKPLSKAGLEGEVRIEQ